MTEDIRYGNKIDGDKGNYNWPVRFDDVDGYIGITQYNDADVDRILLSPAQVKGLIKFVKESER